MALPVFLGDLGGTLLSKLAIGRQAARRYLKSVGSGGNVGLAVRNAADTADAEITALKVNISGPDLVMNSDAVGSGSDFTYTFSVPAAGMTGAVHFTLPVADGSALQYMGTDGAGNLGFYALPGGATNVEALDKTTFAFNTSSPLAMFTKPANNKIPIILVYVDTAFDDATATIAIGITGTTSKYVGTGEVDLSLAGVYIIYPDVDVVVGAESIIATISPGSSTAGAGRLEVAYVLPS